MPGAWFMIPIYYYYYLFIYLFIYLFCRILMRTNPNAVTMHSKKKLKYVILPRVLLLIMSNFKWLKIHKFLTILIKENLFLHTRSLHVPGPSPRPVPDAVLAGQMRGDFFNGRQRKNMLTNGPGRAFKREMSLPTTGSGY